MIPRTFYGLFQLSAAYNFFDICAHTSGVVWYLIEIAPKVEIPRLGDQLAEIWRVLQLRAVWRPMVWVAVCIRLQAALVACC